MKIFIPSDLTENSLNIIEKWIPGLDKVDTEIYLVNIIEPLRGGDALMIDLAKIQHQEGIAAFDKFNAKLGLKNAKLNFLIYEGYYSRKLAELAKSYEPDIVLMHSQPKTGIDKYLVGQKSQKFIGELKCPILIVPATFESLNFAGIGLAVDSEDMPTENNVAQLRVIESFFGVEAKPFHIQVKDNESTEIYDNFSAWSGGNEVVVEKAVSVATGISDFIEQENIDLLAMVTHKRKFLDRFLVESNSRRVVSANKIAALILNN